MSSKLDNFKGNMHKLTKEDCVKGGKVRSAKKALAARLNAMKNGKYSKGLKTCDKCTVTFTCPLKTKETHQKCELFSAKMIYSVMKARELPTIEEFDKFISEFVIDYTKSQDKDLKTSMKHFMPFMEKLFDIREAMHK
jgi:hypothetical protein